jgi:hypothetical protein
MGGTGSGRQGGRATIERTNSIKLSVHHVMRSFDGVRPIGRKWTWSESSDGEVTAFVVPLPNSAGAFALNDCAERQS